jgi:hypothetical protein
MERSIRAAWRSPKIEEPAQPDRVKAVLPMIILNLSEVERGRSNM